MATKSDAATVARERRRSRYHAAASLEIVRRIAKRLNITVAMHTERSEAHPMGCIVIDCLADDVTALEHEINAHAKLATVPIAFVPRVSDDVRYADSAADAQEDLQAQVEPERQSAPAALDTCAHTTVRRLDARDFGFQCVDCAAKLSHDAIPDVCTILPVHTTEIISQTEEDMPQGDSEIQDALPQETSLLQRAIPPPQSAHSISWTTCFVCQIGKAAVHSNGRCQECYEFFRHTGTDRSPAEIAATQGLQVREIMGKGLLKEAKDTTLLAAAHSRPTTPQSTNREAQLSGADLQAILAAQREATSPVTGPSSPGESMPGIVLDRPPAARSARIQFLCDLVAQGDAAMQQALDQQSIIVHLPGESPRRRVPVSRTRPTSPTTAAAPKEGSAISRLLAQIAPEVQAQMRADRAAGMSFVAIDLKYGYADAKETRGRMSWTVCKYATTTPPQEED